MIKVDNIYQIVQNKILGSNLFIVDISIDNNNNIKIKLDSNKGINIDECVEVSKYVEKNLNKDVEDFKLEVSSPGLNQPFMVIDQYKKNIGKNLILISNEGERITGKLIKVKTTEIELETNNNIISKKETSVLKKVLINFDKIKSAKIKLSF
ncbi:MAG: ribosome assembly cofactor RimP [Bacteroidales bacterium]|nr:ribosome assembly cofactor RimP [Bacteroidales bacterium]